MTYQPTFYEKAKTPPDSELVEVELQDGAPLKENTIHLQLNGEPEFPLSISFFNEENELIERSIFDGWNKDRRGNTCNISGPFWIGNDSFLYSQYIRMEVGCVNKTCPPLMINQFHVNYSHICNFYNSEELKKFRQSGKYPTSLKKGSAELIFTNFFKYLKENKFKEKPFVIFLAYTGGIGDVFLAEPTIRKISNAIGRKVWVVTKRPQVFFNHPNVDKIFIHTKELIDHSDKQHTKAAFSQSSNGYHGRKVPPTENEDLYDQLILKPQEAKETNIMFKYTCYDHVGRAANFAGFSLTNKEKSMRYYPTNPIKNKEYSHLEDYVVCSVNSSSPLRFWSFDKWNKLFRLLKESGIKVAVAGRPKFEPNNNDSNWVTNTNWECPDKFTPNHTEEVDLSGVLDLTATNNSLEDQYHMINQCKVLVTTDTAPLHIAGTTDTWIVLIGAQYHPEFIMPYRHGSQKYKSIHVPGSCTRFCGSDISYSVDPEKFFKNATLKTDFGCFATQDQFCFESFDEPLCHPDPNTVFEKIKDIFYK